MNARSLLNMKVASGLFVCAWFGFTIWAAYAVFYGNRTHLYADNGLIENFQAVLLTIACLVYLAAAAFGRKSNQLIHLFCSVLCLSFLLREVDAEDFNLPRAVVFLGHGIGRNTMLVTAFIAIAVYAALHRSYYMNAVVRFTKSRTGRLLIAGGLFLLIGGLLDQTNRPLHHEFYEEIAELLGYIFILLSAISAISFLGGKNHRVADSDNDVIVRD